MKLKIYFSKLTIISIFIFLGITNQMKAQTIVPIGAGSTYKTIQTAYNSIKDAAVSTPITGAYVLEIQADYDPTAGTTLETFPITLNAINGASADNTITIKPATGVKKTLSYPNQTVVATGITCANGATSITVTNDVSILSTSSYVGGQGASNNPFKLLVGVHVANKVLTLASGTITSARNNATLYFGPQLTKTIILDGAKYVIIDGVSRTDANTGLTIANPNCIYAQTIHLTGSAQYNTVKNCVIRGANQTSTNTGGGVGATVFYNTASYNTFTMNNVCDMEDGISPMPIAAFQATGSGTNTYNTISENNIYNIENMWASSAANTGFLNFGSPYNANSHHNDVLNNKMFWTRTANFASGTTIALVGTGGSMDGLSNRFEGNTIGYANANGTGTSVLNGTGASFKGVNAFKNFTCKNNTIANIDVTGVNFTGIEFGTSNTSTIPVDDVCYGNTVQNIKLTLSAAGTLVGIKVNVANPYHSNIKNNIVSNLKVESASLLCTAIGIDVTGTPAAKIFNYTNNVVKDITAGLSSSSTANIAYGIRTGLNAVTVEKNLVYNIAALNNTNTAIVSGIQTNTGFTVNQWITSTPYALNVIVRNGYKVYKSTTTGTVTSGATAPTHSTGSVSDGAVTWAYQYAITPISTTLMNNIVRVGISTTNTDSKIYGICQNVQFGISDVNKVYHNTVYIGGTAPTATSQNTFAFYSIGSVIPTTNELQNNIFANQRTNTDGTAKHYAIGNATAGLIKSCNNNLYWANIVGFDGATDKTDLNAWKETIATGSDAASQAGDPLFVDATATIPDMHLSTGTPADHNGSDLSAVVADDFYGSVRSSLSPSDIGAVAYFNTTNVESFKSNKQNIYTSNSSIVINNAKGQSISIYSVTGKLENRILSDTDKLIIPKSKGFYIVSMGKERTKVLVN